jgi:hypothetical protein
MVKKEVFEWIRTGKKTIELTLEPFFTSKLQRG